MQRMPLNILCYTGQPPPRTKNNLARNVNSVKMEKHCSSRTLTPFEGIFFLKGLNKLVEMYLINGVQLGFKVIRPAMFYTLLYRKILEML